MRWWDERVLPKLIDRSLSVGQVMKLRELVCAGLSGRVLEIGFGSGLNLEKLPIEVTSLDAVEPSDRGWALSQRRRDDAPVPVARIGLDGERLGAGDATYDAVLCTFTLCTIPDVERSLAEVRRVLRPEGRLHFLEHGLAPDAGVRRWQQRLEPMQRRLFGGCHLTRDVAGLVLDSGLGIDELHQEYLPGPSCGAPWGYTSWGTASAPGGR